MAKRKVKPVEKVELDIHEQVAEAYDQCMADIYDHMVECFDKVGVRVKELLEEVQYMEEDEIEVELEDDDDEEYDYDS